jgi:hypothetical protein
VHNMKGEGVGRWVGQRVCWQEVPWAACVLARPRWSLEQRNVRGTQTRTHTPRTHTRVDMAHRTLPGGCAAPVASLAVHGEECSGGRRGPTCVLEPCGIEHLRIHSRMRALELPYGHPSRAAFPEAQIVRSESRGGENIGSTVTSSRPPVVNKSKQGSRDHCRNQKSRKRLEQRLGPIHGLGAGRGPRGEVSAPRAPSSAGPGLFGKQEVGGQLLHEIHVKVKNQCPSWFHIQAVVLYRRAVRDRDLARESTHETSNQQEDCECD